MSVETLKLIPLHRYVTFEMLKHIEKKTVCTHVLAEYFRDSHTDRV